MVIFILCVLLLVPFGLLMLAGMLEFRHRAANGIVRPDYYGLEEEQSQSAMRTLEDIAHKREQARRLMDTDRAEAERLIAEADAEEEVVRAGLNPN